MNRAAIKTIEQKLLACSSERMLREIQSSHSREDLLEAAKILKEPTHRRQYQRVYFWQVGRHCEIAIVADRHPVAASFGEI